MTRLSLCFAFSPSDRRLLQTGRLWEVFALILEDTFDSCGIGLFYLNPLLALFQLPDLT